MAASTAMIGACCAKVDMLLKSMSANVRRETDFINRTLPT
jgi:hypothetical protein